MQTERTKYKKEHASPVQDSLRHQLWGIRRHEKPDEGVSIVGSRAPHSLGYYPLIGLREEKFEFD